MLWSALLGPFALRWTVSQSILRPEYGDESEHFGQGQSGTERCLQGTLHFHSAAPLGAGTSYGKRVSRAGKCRRRGEVERGGSAGVVDEAWRVVER